MHRSQMCMWKEFRRVWQWKCKLLDTKVFTELFTGSYFQLCMPIAFHYQDCMQPNQCEFGLGPGSLCDNGKCICDSIHQNITDNKRTVCQRKVLHGDVCKEHSDCLFYLGEATMNCFQHRCTCRSGYELFDAYRKECVKINSSKSSFSNAASRFTVLAVATLVTLLKIF